MPKRPPLTPITDGPQYVRMTDLPARIRIGSPKAKLPRGRALLEISIEEYDVPEDGGDVLAIDSKRRSKD
jgi:hypothetical protein